MSISWILKLMPWHHIADIVLEVVQLVIDDEDNDFSDDLKTAVSNTIDKAKDKHPDVKK